MRKTYTDFLTYERPNTLVLLQRLTFNVKVDDSTEGWAEGFRLVIIGPYWNRPGYSKDDLGSEVMRCLRFGLGVICLTTERSK